MIDFLYFSQKKTKEQLGLKPSGIIDVDALLKNKPFWKQINLDTELQKKTLVLSHRFAKYLDEDDLSELYRALINLLEQGFDLYCYTEENCIEKFNQSELSYKDFKGLTKNIKPSHSNQVRRMAAQDLSLPYDEIIELDEYCCQRLVTGNNKRTIPISWLLRYSNKTAFAKPIEEDLLKLITTESPLPEAIEIDEISMESLALLDPIEIDEISMESKTPLDYVYIPTIPGLSARLVLTPDNYDEMIDLIRREKNRIPNLLRLSLEEFSGAKEDMDLLMKQLPLDLADHPVFKNIEVFRLCEENGYEEPFFCPETALHLLPGLKKLQLKSVNILTQENILVLDDEEIVKLEDEDAQTPDTIVAIYERMRQIAYAKADQNEKDFFNEVTINLPKLEEINCTHSLISNTALEIILKAAPNLKKASFRNLIFNCYSLKLSLEENSLPHLAEMDLKKSGITENSLDIILKAAPNLKKINLKKCLIKEIYFSIPPNLLPHLEEIDLSESKINTSILQKILKAAPNLKKIDLSYSRGLYEDLNFSEHSLAYLEEIDLSQSHINNASLEHLLKAAPNLKKVNLYNCRNLDAGLNLSEHSLTHLEEIDLSQSHINNASLEHLLKAAPNLKKVSLYGCQGLDKDVNIAPYSLAYLEEIDLCQLSINNASLEHLLKAAPNLKKVGLCGCHGLDKDVNIAPNSLVHLEEIDLSASKINTASLEQILKAAPNLKKVSLYGCQRLDRDLNIAPNSLAHLEEIDLRLSKINTASLEQILKATPNLKKVSLHGCQRLDRDFILAEGSMPHLARIDWHVANLSAATKNVLLKATPKLSGIADITGAPEAQSSRLTSAAARPMSIDADTKKDPDKEFNLDRIFYSASGTQCPSVSNYRLYPYTQLEVSPSPCQLQESFTLKTGPLDLEFCDIRRYTKDVFSMMKHLPGSNQGEFYGKRSLWITQEWQPLPSISPNEVITAFHTEPVIDVEIKYSKQHNSYFIKSLESQNQNISIDFLLSIPKKKAELHTLPKKIQTAIEEFRTFGEGALVLSKNKPTGRDYLQAIISQKKGACRHRAVAFKAWMEKHYPKHLTRIITNDCHAFVEVKNQHGDWVSCDLGGYAAQLHINEQQAPKPLEGLQEQVTTVTLSETICEEPLYPQLNTYLKALSPWTRAVRRIQTPQAYVQQVTAISEHKKKLLQCNSSEGAHHLARHIQQHCHATQRPIYTINSPEDLVCQAPFIQRDGHKGIIKNGPGGQLYDFLQTHASGNPILLVNYDRFDADDLVRFNTLIDAQRSIDGVPLPDSMQVIGLLNQQKPDCYEGADFYSRFDLCEPCPVTEAALNKGLRELPVRPVSNKEQKSDALIVIDLFKAPDWKERMVGQWSLEQNDLIYKPGPLKEALESKRPVLLKNAPWDDEAFVHFWQQSLLNKEIDFAGERLPLDDPFELLRDEGYDWDVLRPFVQEVPEKPSVVHALNPTLLSGFFAQHQCDSQQQSLSIAAGIIEQHAHQELPVWLTRALSEDEWARLLSTCQKHQVTLKVHSPDIGLPDFICPEPKTSATNASPPKLELNKLQATQIIQSTDVDATCKAIELETNSTDWLMLDVSECDGSDLLTHVSAQLNEQKLRFEFNESQQVLLKALEEGRSVLLKGDFSQRLADDLAPLLLKRKLKHKVKGQLILVSESTDTLTYAEPTQHQVDASLKKELLIQEFGVSKNELFSDELLKQPFVHLCARMRHRAEEKLDSNRLWDGLLHLSATPQLPPFDAKTAKDEAQAFNEARLQKVQRILEVAPFVFLAGLTGVGKSTFVEQELTKIAKIYLGETNTQVWINDTSDQLKVLFIDEANLSHRHFSEFEGLFNTPPGILLYGQYHQLSPNHKVVFAGNPLSYGDERHLASLFERHGNAVVFDPLPPSFIYKKILEPVFKESSINKKNRHLVCQHVFEVYRFLCERSQNEVLISPRELQMMALMLVATTKNKKSSQEHLLTKAREIAYAIARPLVPEQELAGFDTRFRPQPTEKKKRPSPKPQVDDFIITPSRQAVMSTINSWLDVRALRRKGQNDAQRYGGLGALVLEGEPGIGKSEVVIQLLLQKKYKRVSKTCETNHPSKAFRVIPASLGVAEKEHMLRGAFEQGDVVIMDEMNSSPAMERLLNALLMGRTPEGTRPKQPGFMVIGTQNPCTMAGRRLPSRALKRRMMEVKVPPYPADDFDQQGTQ